MAGTQCFISYCHQKWKLFDNFRETTLPFSSLSKRFPFKSDGNDVTRRPIRTYLISARNVCMILLVAGYSVKWYPGLIGFHFMSHLPAMHLSPTLCCLRHYHILQANKSNRHLCKQIDFKAGLLVVSPLKRLCLRLSFSHVQLMFMFFQREL